MAQDRTEEGFIFVIQRENKCPMLSRGQRENKCPMLSRGQRENKFPMLSRGQRENIFLWSSGKIERNVHKTMSKAGKNLSSSGQLRNNFLRCLRWLGKGFLQLLFCSVRYYRTARGTFCCMEKDKTNLYFTAHLTEKTSKYWTVQCAVEETQNC